MKKINLFLLLYLLLTIQFGLFAQVTKNVYFVGNSVTDAINYNGLDALAESKGNTHIWGRHMIPGAPLSWIWTHPNDGISEPPYGLYPNALPNYVWNAISLQPFDRGLDGTEGDATMAGNFINQAKGKSPQVQIYVYSRWPRKQSTFPETADGWNQLWTRTYGSSGPNTEETADYFVKLTNRLRTNHTDIKPVLMVPVGQVFYALNNKMKAGQVPGYTSIWQVYSDGIHMTGTGSYIAAVTYFATLYGQNPVGLSIPSQFGTVDPTVARIIQETAWDVVTKEPLSGITGCVSNCGTGLKPAETPSGTVAGLNYKYYEGTWSTLPGFGSLTPAKSGSVTNFDLSVRNRNDNFAFQYTGYVNVPSDGTYTFYTSSDDGSKLYIGTTEVVNNDGLHGIQERSGTIGLKAGKHSITVNFFEATGGENLTVSYAGPGVAKQTIPNSALSSVPVNTTNNPPTAVLNATPTSGTAPLTVSFNANGSSDPDAGDFILGYEWDFGDGSAFNNSNAPTHTYNSPGTYTAKLRVMDNRNLYSTQVSRTITVTGSGTPSGGLLAHEHFNATSGTLHNVSTGTGWGAGWLVQNADVSVPGYNVAGSASLAYSTLATSGKYAIGGDSYQTSGRALNTSTSGPFATYLTNGNIGATGKTLWISALLRKDGTNDEEASLTLHAGSIVTYPNPGLVSIGYFGTSSNNNGTRYWSLKIGSIVYRSSTAITTGQTALLVAKLDFGSTNSVSLFVNPASLGGSAPASASTSGTTTTSIAFKSLAYYGGSNLSQSAVDEIRFGDSYASVTPTTSTARIAQAEAGSDAFEVYPNPSNAGYVQVRFIAKEKGTAKVVLTNTKGQAASKQAFPVEKGVNTLRVSTAVLPHGLYLLNLNHGYQQLSRKVLIDN